MIITVDQPCKLSYVFRSKIFIENFSTSTVNIWILNCPFFENYTGDYPTDSEGNYELENFYKSVVENITETEQDNNPVIDSHNFDLRYKKVDSYNLIRIFIL